MGLITGDQRGDPVCSGAAQDGVDIPYVQMTVVHRAGNDAARLLGRDISPGETIKPGAVSTMQQPDSLLALSGHFGNGLQFKGRVVGIVEV